MDDEQDELSAWLRATVEPLPPPPGTFELIRRRARRRRSRKAAISAVGGAAVAAAVAAVAAAPHLATTMLSAGRGPAGSGVAAAHPASGPPEGGSGPAIAYAAPAASGRAGGGRAGRATAPPVPPGFAPASVTFISTGTGWVIGQAGGAGHPCATRYCTSMARTDDAGQTWYGVPAPVTGAPDGSSGVSQVRFLNALDGWAFGPELFATHDGGQRWARIDTHGMRVTSLKAAGSRAFALLAECGGTGPDFAAQCTSYSLYSAAAGGDTWGPAGGAVSGLGAGGQDTSASLALAAGRGYLLAPDGMLYAEPADGSGSWHAVALASPGATDPAGTARAGGTSPWVPRSPGAACLPGQAQPDGQPSGALLAAASSEGLVLACPGMAGPGGGTPLFASSDGGRTWRPLGTAPAGGTAASLAALPGGRIVLATSRGIDTSAGGVTWRQAAQGAAAPAGGFTYVGMISAGQGVAVPADAAGHAIWLSFDRGQTWQRSDITGT